MRTERFVLSDPQWDVIAPLLPGKASDCGVTAKDNRLFLEAVLWRVRTGAKVYPERSAYSFAPCGIYRLASALGTASFGGSDIRST